MDKWSLYRNSQGATYEERNFGGENLIQKKVLFLQRGEVLEIL